MKLQQLKYLLAIVDNGLNITAAADRMFTSQPGVSKQLKLLEEELGLQLFVRKGKSLHRITRAGERVVKHARAIMDQVDRVRSLADDFYKEEEGTLTIAATNTQARYALPEILRELRRQYPKVCLNLYQGTSDQIADMMSGSDIDFAIASGPDSRFGNLLRLPGYKWDRVVIVPNNHALAKIERDLTLRDIADHPIVSCVFSIEGDQSLHDVFSAKGLDANIVFTAQDAEVIKTYVRMGAGIGVVAGMAYEPTDRKDLTAIPVTGLFQRSMTWVGIRRNTVLRCYMADFLRLFASHLSFEQIERIVRADNQHEVNELVRKTELPIRNGFSCRIFAAA